MVVFRISYFSLDAIGETPCATPGDPSLPQTGYSELYRVILITAAALLFLEVTVTKIPRKAQKRAL